ncbi:MAG: YcxB family protein [Gammaproteobacteria bacterium]|nr:YcxB family protein [Gammaproteobacteria bacterium]
MMKPIKLRYSESLIREAVRSYWWKQVGPAFLITEILLAAGLVYLIVIGNRTWFIGMLGTVLILGFVTITASYIVQLRRSLKRLQQMKAPEATLELGEERFRVTTNIGSSEIDWSLISQIWRFDKVWFLCFSPNEFMTLPIAELTQEAKSFIISKAEANGAKIL